MSGIMALTALDRDASSNKYSTWSRQQWATVITAATTAKGADNTAGIWKEVTDIAGSGTASVTISTNANIVGAALKNKAGTDITTKAELNTALGETGTGVTTTIITAAEKIAGYVELQKVVDSTATATYLKYLEFPRRTYSGDVKTKYTAAVYTSSGYKFDEDQIALNLYARPLRHEKFVAATTFKINSSINPTTAAFSAGMTTSLAALSSGSNAMNLFEASLGLYALEMADNDAFAVKAMKWDYTASGEGVADYSLGTLADLKTDI